MSGNGVRSAALLALALASTLAARAPALAGGADLLAEIDRAGRAIVAAGCARPVESKTSRVGGGSSGAVDEMRAIDCRSFRAATWVERDAAQQRSAPMALVVLGVEPRLPAGIAVGATPAQVQALLGMPGLHRGHSFGYALGRAQPPRDTLTFELVDGRVSAISWNWAVD
jgi:hypothetical protein